MKLLFKVLVVGVLALPLQASEAEKNRLLDQLETNATNANANLEAFEDNLKVVKDNQKKLKAYKKELGESTKKLAIYKKDNTATKAAIQVQITKVDKLKQEEQLKLDQEQLQLGELQKLMASLQANIEKRNSNIETYSKQNEDLNTELAEWDQKKQKIIRIGQTIEKKKIEAAKTLKDLKSKEATYLSETKRWKKLKAQNADLRKAYANFD
ncbi:MAG: hypothetical protein AB8E15_06820 [Bdellovibrionales bacterium]